MHPPLPQPLLLLLLLPTFKRRERGCDVSGGVVTVALLLREVLVVLCGPPHGLASVVDHGVEPTVHHRNMQCERLDRWDRPKVQPVEV